MVNEVQLRGSNHFHKHHLFLFLDRGKNIEKRNRERERERKGERNDEKMNESSVLLPNQQTREEREVDTEREREREVSSHSRILSPIRPPSIPSSLERMRMEIVLVIRGLVRNREGD